MGASHCLQTRTLRSPLISCPMREGLPHEAQTSCTLETLIRLSFSAMPPLVLPWTAFTAFFIIMTCSTRILPSPGNTRRTRPCLPLSRPVMTLTVSFFLMSILCCGAHEHALHHRAFLGGAVGRSFLHGSGEHIAQVCRESNPAAERQDDLQLAGAGVIGDFQHRSHHYSHDNLSEN